MRGEDEKKKKDSRIVDNILNYVGLLRNCLSEYEETIRSRAKYNDKQEYLKKIKEWLKKYNTKTKRKRLKKECTKLKL